MFRDYYQILKLSPKSSHKDIKQAYRRLALKYHPDRNPNNKAAEENFKIVLEAYQTLGYPDKRKIYDVEHEVVIQLRLRDGNAQRKPHFPFASSPWPKANPNSRTPHPHEGTSMPVPCDQDDSIIGRFYEYSIRRQTRVSQEREMPPGVERVHVKCPDCNGHGLRHFILRCARCAGEGYYHEVRGSDYQSCPACRGNGYSELFFSECLCDYCDGMGIVHLKVKDSPCPHCHGYGWTLADTWWRRMFMPGRAFIYTKEECYWCGGTGSAPTPLETEPTHQCPACRGYGWTGLDILRQKRPCQRCHSTGRKTGK